MNKREFHLLLSRYYKGVCSEQEKSIVEQWLLQLGDGYSVNDETEIEQLQEKMWEAISFKTNIVKARPYYKVWYSIAASLIIMIGLGWLTYKLVAPVVEVSEITAATPEFSVEANQTDKILAVKLPDGSVVSLEPNSSIKYSKIFVKNTREVYLKGGAFFDVSSNQDKPFLVYSGNIVTKVLGTSFWVNEKNNNKEIEVSVVSGKVSVSTSGNLSGSIPENKKVLLTANQKAIYNEKNKVFETSLVENPVMVIKEGIHQDIKLPQFQYQNALVSDVLSDLTQAYGIEIIVGNDRIERCTFRGDISKQSLYTKLELICSSVNATFEIHGTRILISGKGC